MRTIIFRAWDKINKQMIPHERLSVLLKNVRDDSQWAYMQFTGLKDKNGKEMYEGDIVRGDENNYEVIWENERARFNIKKWYNGSQECETCAFSEQFCHEVIGNKHENPELLNG